ncbi:hypothetical protein C8R43DRAFT_1136766 [Mycena crocata]|nr:hypothetical protein C8R43DRAFT_1136766 [Mycena crocata]
MAPVLISTCARAASAPPHTWSMAHGDPDEYVDSSVVWANRALISAAGIFFYDFVPTLVEEIELDQHSRRELKLFWSFLSLR